MSGSARHSGIWVILQYSEIFAGYGNDGYGNDKTKCTDNVNIILISYHMLVLVNAFEMLSQYSYYRLVLW